MAGVKELECYKTFKGFQYVYSHESNSTNCTMKFSLYKPPGASSTKQVPVLYWLSGLTCTEQNFMIKSGFQRYAAQYNLCVVGPDTSPRNVDIEGQDDEMTLGYGAGFYVDATTEKWKKHYNMYSYVTKELIDVIETNFDFVQPGNRSISGHSMGGHGALIAVLKNPDLYKSVSAFAPICSTLRSKFSQIPFKEYLGEDKEAWKEYDAYSLAKKYSGPRFNVLIDQGTCDPYLQDCLYPDDFMRALTDANIDFVFHKLEGYEHGYFFVSTFLEDHFKHHERYLCPKQNQ